jgi:hypothetical protein
MRATNGPPALVLLLALAGCAGAPDRSDSFGDPPSDEQRLDQTLKASGKGPSQWSPAVTIPLSPVLLAADTTIKFVDATYRYLRDLFGGHDDKPDVPERIERQAEKIPKN